MQNQLGAYCALRRKQLGLRQSDVAAKLGYTVQAISRFENGLSAMGLSSLPILANVLQVSLDDLFAENPAPAAFEENPGFDPEAFAHNLAYFRQQKGLSQTQMALALGCNRRNLANYEKGVSQPTLDFVVSYLAYSKIKPSMLFGPEQVASPVVLPKKHHAKAILLFAALALALSGGATGLFFALQGKAAKNTSLSSLTSSGSASPFSSSGSASSSPSSSVASSSASSSSASSSASSSSNSSSSSSPSAAQQDYDALTSFSFTINHGTDVRLMPNIYYLLTPSFSSSWNMSQDHDLLEWVCVSGTASSSTRYEEGTAYGYLTVPSDAPDGKSETWSCHIHNPANLAEYKTSANTVEVTFDNPAASYVHDESKTTLEEITGVSLDINGLSDIGVHSQTDYRVNFKVYPLGWYAANVANYDVFIQSIDLMYISVDENKNYRLHVDNVTSEDVANPVVLFRYRHGSNPEKKFSTTLTIRGLDN